MAANVEYIDLSERAIGVLAGRLEHLVEAVAVDLRDEIVLQMEPGPPRTGRTYRVPGTKTRYTASAPGEPPAVREGAYAASWKATPAVRDGSTIVAAAYTDLKTKDGRYVLGDLLEHGTVKMAARPHVRPAMEIIARRWRARIRSAP